MEKIFIVTHVHDLPNGEEDFKFVGVYATADAANAAVQRARQRTGFEDFPEGFSVDPYVIGQDHWVDGFVTWKPVENGSQPIAS
ncbi:MAG: hypothetical protein J0I77_22860 [Rudaea sp.]|uniref:DUF7336 domain-containing protein n=1 Tax=unclassified Rudaea TaxID=2627037 RepID=UPI0010F78631|nr:MULTISPECIES: hypothetical protein [unclassified Rudaea]MBN8888572.1 hypothetical protein [Rudaea sp.]